MSDAPFAVTLRHMRQMLVEAECGLGLLEALAVKYGIMEGIEAIDLGDARALIGEVRVTMRTLGFEATAVLVQAMLLAGDPMLAQLMGLDLDRPVTNEPN